MGKIIGIDLGTTKIAASLVDLTTGDELAVAGALNPQIGYGEDVISRIAAANRSDEELELLARLARRAINDITARCLEAAGLACAAISKVNEGRPDVSDMLKNEQISLIINTTEGKKAIHDSYTIRASALQHKVSYTTTIAGANATVRAIDYLEVRDVTRLQELHEEIQQDKKEATA